MRILLFVFSFVLSTWVAGQNVQPVVPRSDYYLRQLSPSRGPLQHYVNFDDLKLIVGREWLSHKVGAFFFDVQLLWPYAAFKESKIFHLAYGISVGRNSFAWQKSRLIFSDGLTDIIEDKSKSKAVQKTVYVGPTAFLFRQFTNRNRLELMVGSSLRFNVLGNKLIYFPDSKTKVFDGGDVEKISIPLLFQLSYRLGGATSVGIALTKDLKERFKGTVTGIKGTSAGVSFALKI